MKIIKHSKTYRVNFLLFLLALITVSLYQEQRPHFPLKDKTTFTFNEGFPSFSPESIRLLSFGYRFVWSSLLWIRFLRHTPPKSMGSAEVSWIFVDLNAISVIDQDFSPVYTHGALFLSVITEDKNGARLLLEKGSKKYPNSLRIHSALAYHYLFELKDRKKAAQQYQIASRIPGAPDYYALLAATTMQKEGNTMAAIAFLQDMRENAKDPKVRKKLLQKIHNLEMGSTERSTYEK